MEHAVSLGASAGLSFMIQYTRLLRGMMNQTRASMVMVLNTTWKTDICMMGSAIKLWYQGIRVACRGQTIAKNSREPRKLNSTWKRATRFASRLQGRDARMAVKLVPRFAPITMKMADSNWSNPLATMATLIPIAAEEDWIRAEKIVPIKNNQSGKVILLNTSSKKLTMIALPLSAELMAPRPMKRRPNVMHIFAVLTHFSVCVARRIAAPMKTRNMMKYRIRNAENTKSSEVRLLPMLMPMTRPVAWKRVSMPPLTKLIIMAVVGVEDCVMPTAAMPRPTFAKRFFPVFWKNRFSFSDGAPNIFVSMTIASKNTPIPVNSSNMEVIRSQNNIEILRS